MAAITAQSRSVADGTESNNSLDFLIADFALRAMPGDDPLISLDAGPAEDSDRVRVTATIGSLTETFTLPRGANLLEASSYDDSCAAFLTALAPVLAPLTGSGEPLEGSELILAGGFSDDGDAPSPAA